MGKLKFMKNIDPSATSISSYASCNASLSLLFTLVKFHQFHPCFVRQTLYLLFNVLCITLHIVSENSVNYIIGTNTGYLLVYQDSVLKWAAKTTRPPVYFLVTSLLYAFLMVLL